MTAAWRTTDLEGLVAHHMAGPAFARRIAEQEGENLNTDDRNLLEYGFARNLGRGAVFGPHEIWVLSHQLGLDRPAITGQVDWARVDARRVQWFGAERAEVIPPEWPSSLRLLHEQVTSYDAGDLAGVRKAWLALPREPETPFELAMVGEALAAAGEEPALAFADRLGDVRPAEGLAIRARCFLAQGKVPDAALVLRDALVAYRQDPWAYRDLMQRTVQLAPALAGTDPALGAMLLDALAQPFAVMNLESVRQWVRLKLTVALRPERCTEAFAAYEQSIPWSEWFLTQRLGCYKARDHALASSAEKDLAAFLDAKPPRLIVGGIGASP
jgi:spermidine synthase